MSKHTPGPWDCEFDNVQMWVFREGHTDENVICDIVGREYDKETGDIVCTDEDVSNARLIAAAPELLEACNLSLTFLRKLRDEHPSQWVQIADILAVTTWDTLKAAIAKAEGEGTR